MTSGGLYNFWHGLARQTQETFWPIVVVGLVLIGAIAATPGYLLVCTIWPHFSTFAFLALAVPILSIHIAIYLILKEKGLVFSLWFCGLSLMLIPAAISFEYSGAQVAVIFYSCLCNFISGGIVSRFFLLPNVDKPKKLIRLYGKNLMIISAITVLLCIFGIFQINSQPTLEVFSYSEFLILFTAIISVGICYLGRIIYTGAKNALPDISDNPNQN